MTSVAMFFVYSSAIPKDLPHTGRNMPLCHFAMKHQKFMNHVAGLEVLWRYGFKGFVQAYTVGI